MDRSFPPSAYMHAPRAKRLRVTDNVEANDKATPDFTKVLADLCLLAQVVEFLHQPQQAHVEVSLARLRCSGKHLSKHELIVDHMRHMWSSAAVLQFPIDILLHPAQRGELEVLSTRMRELDAQALRQQLRSDKHLSRTAAALALANFDSKTTIAALARALGDRSKFVSLASTMALGKIGNQHAHMVLRAALSNFRRATGSDERGALPADAKGLAMTITARFA